MTKKILLTLLTIALTIIIGYGLYRLYDTVMTDVQMRLSEAIAEGIREGLGSFINPRNWPQALLGS